MSHLDQALRRAEQQAGSRSHERRPRSVGAHSWTEVEVPIVPSWQYDRFPAEQTLITPQPTCPLEGPEPEVEQRPTTGDRAASQKLGDGFSSSLDEKLVVTERAHADFVEQYRRLAASLHRAREERDIKVVMVASAVSGEGKTLTALNLALTLAESYRRRVLLIDGDLRSPRMHELLGVPNVCGLNEALKESEDRPLSLLAVSPRLSVLPAGQPDSDPMGALTSSRMRRLIREAAATFEWVILDTPPVLLFPDTNLLAAMMDVAVLVVQAGGTPDHVITRAVETLGRERVLGVVLNRISDPDYDDGRYRHRVRKR
jgi:protein-tyrosine kinase